MITSVNFGNVYADKDGRNRVGGTASGFDTQSLINGLVGARRLPAVSLEAELERNAAKSGAYSELNTIVTSLRDAANFLRRPPGVQNQSDNIFEYRAGTVRSNTEISGANYLRINAEPGADVADYSVTVDQLATLNVKTTNSFAATSLTDAAVGNGLAFNAGTYTFGPDAVEVTLENGDTLGQLLTKINSVSEESGVRASAIKVDGSNYRVTLKTTDTGVAENYTIGSNNIQAKPSFFSDAVLNLDAGDIDGDGDESDNPVADQTLTTIGEISGTTTFTPTDTDLNLDVDGANGAASVVFGSTGTVIEAADAASVNSGGPYDTKSFVLQFETGSDVSGTQVIYDQGDATSGFSVVIADDPANPGTQTLFAIAYDTSFTDNPTVLNLGEVNANEAFDVRLEFDASANPGSADAANTFTAFVGGSQVAQATGVAQMSANTGGAAIGGMSDGVVLPDGTVGVGDGNYFTGAVSEVLQFNRTLTAGEVTELSDYLDAKYVSGGYQQSDFSNVGYFAQTNAVDSQLTIDGTQITRSSNTIDDLVDGITFEIIQETPGATELDVQIDADTELTKTGILNLIDAYNGLRLFQSRQTELDSEGLPNETALLSGSSALRSIVSDVTNQFSSIIAGLTDGDPNELGALGITFTDYPGDAETPFTRNILTLDEDKLDNALANDFDAVRNVFEFNMTSDSENIQIFSRSNALRATGAQLSIDTATQTYTATYTINGAQTTVNLDARAINGGGILLSGPSGSALAGLELIFDSTGQETINLTFSQGIADRVYNATDSSLDEDSGILSIETASLGERDTRIGEEILRIDRQIERYRDQLLERFSALEQAVSQVNSLLQQLDAQANAQNS